MCDELFKYCDLNGDGSVSKIDALILTRNLASWSGYETLPIQNLKAIGDFNDDGNINSNDYTALLDAINTSNEILQTVQNVLCVDFNLDGVVDNTDAIILYNYINNNFAFKELTYIDYTQKYGDLNCDGVITIDDLVILRAHVNQTETIDCEPLLDFADLNGDGEVNSEDVTILKNFLNGEDITLPQVA